MSKKNKLDNGLAKLKQFTTVVADTGDVESIAKYQPQDATTNPSLLLAASKMDQYQNLVADAIEYGKKNGKDQQARLSAAMDKLAVNFGLEILKIIPGRVSTEIDARLSFDTQATIAKAREIIALYKANGIAKDRILIKIASTWEGIQAAKALENEGIHCNLTLMFSLMQAAAAAEAKATLISPFVGRITDFFKAAQKVDGFPANQDPGVLSVQKIFNYYKYHGYSTVVMGASFRNKEQTLELAGCDFLTISPKLLEELSNSDIDVRQVLNADKAQATDKLDTSESNFRFEMNEDDMATFKLAEGIRKFAADTRKLEDAISSKLQ